MSNVERQEWKDKWRISAHEIIIERARNKNIY